MFDHSTGIKHVRFRCTLRRESDHIPPVSFAVQEAHVNSDSFPHRWLGQNSKQNKLMRQLGDVQIRMRLKVSGDKNEIRQSYIPALFPHIVKPLLDNGAVRVAYHLS